MTERHGERAVFLDPSGARWRRVSRTTTIVVMVVLAGALAVGPNLYAATRVPERVAAAAPEVDLGDAPVIVGEGPMVRVVRVAPSSSGALQAYDAVSGAPVGELTGADAAAARGRTALMQRYGYASGLHRTISLTFDDGPDPTWTPQLLDLLSREHVRATFYDVGNAAVRYPALVRRTVREGHLVANHSLTHANLSEASDRRARVELVATDRILRDLTGEQTPLVRLPYEGDDADSIRETLAGVLRAQRLGYVTASHDFDSLDWKHAAGRVTDIPLPELDGRNLTVLLHDGGGNRKVTLGYVARLVAAAKAQGYTFTTMATAQSGLVPATVATPPSSWDRVTRWVATAALAWPPQLLGLLFVGAVSSIAMSVLNAALAIGRALRRRRLAPAENLVRAGRVLPVSVVLAAYNEQAVIRRTLESILASTYPLLEVVVVDDGSLDATSDVVREVAALDSRVRLLRQANGGKAAALNHGLEAARGDYVVSLDADTVLAPTTIGNLVRHFILDPDGRLGAVAGVVRVGNRTRNLLTRWQALEYLTQIGVERTAQDVLGAIAIIPGACAAWRREAILAVGGYSEATLAEDCDLTLCLHRAGWRVTQDDEAVAFTEAPEDVDGLLAQRTRWSYGTLQAVWKHRDLLLQGRHGWLGMFVLPYYLVSILLPLAFLPLVVFSTVLTVQRQGWGLVAVYVLAFVVAHTLVAAVAVLVMRESPRHLLMVPVYRVVYEPLRAYLLYTSAYLAVRGVRSGWNKLARTGALDTGLIASAEAGATRPLPVVALTTPAAVSARPLSPKVVTP